MQQNRVPIVQNWVSFFAFGFGSGLAPKAPGTWGTLIALPLVLAADWGAVHAEGIIGIDDDFFFFLITLLIVLVSIWVAEKADQQLEEDDHPAIVIDEIAGFFVSMIFLPIEWTSIVMAFVLFRIFDIVKPFPIRQVDKTVKGGIGIVVDDVIAGIYTNVVIQLVV